MMEALQQAIKTKVGNGGKSLPAALNTCSLDCNPNNQGQSSKGILSLSIIKNLLEHDHLTLHQIEHC